MAPIIRAVRAKKATNRGLQRGFSLSGTLQEGLFTGSPVLNEVVLTSSSPLIIRLVPEGLLGTHKGQRQTSTPATHSRRMYVLNNLPQPATPNNRAAR